MTARTAAVALIAAVATSPSYCAPSSGGRASREAVQSILPAAAVSALAPTPAPVGPVRMELADASKPPMYVMRGEPRASGKLVFIHGMCGHPLGYAQSFQWSAAKYGTLIAPQGDRVCAAGSPLAKWSLDTNALDARIVAAFKDLGFTGPIENITVIGYSQGANRAEALARKWPARYTRLIIIASPTKISPYGLNVQAALMMAGTLDRQELMQASARDFAAAGRRSRYMQIPNARHGSMGSSPEATMGEALAWTYGVNREGASD